MNFFKIIFMTGLTMISITTANTTGQISFRELSLIGNTDPEELCQARTLLTANPAVEDNLKTAIEATLSDKDASVSDLIGGNGPAVDRINDLNSELDASAPGAGDATVAVAALRQRISATSFGSANGDMNFTILLVGTLSAGAGGGGATASDLRQKLINFRDRLGVFALANAATFNILNAGSAANIDSAGNLDAILTALGA